MSAGDESDNSYETSGQGSRPVPSLAIVAAARDLECLGPRTSRNVAVAPKGQVVNESTTGGVKGLPVVSPPLAGTAPRRLWVEETRKRRTCRPPPRCSSTPGYLPATALSQVDGLDDRRRARGLIVEQ
ncbi:hypothetical protein CPLU01_08070 [Colletotrichum plurivorum]|uniref:Uncharacterized protein n=1 Tax=Colletotrichum plurivorum TaxID=2175906 RepID=A0A8H6KD78_9PEZI|nr:hypothetical protein CPLU01_08070 [Colletotrichum plurivorum]